MIQLWAFFPYLQQFFEKMQQNMMGKKGGAVRHQEGMRQYEINVF